MEAKQSKFAGMTFVAKQRSGDSCGSNGLPLTPNSIRILGRAQLLKSLHHPNLCIYLDIIRCKHERTIVVCECAGHPLSTAKLLSEECIISIAHDVLSALTFLHSRGIIHRAISRDNLLYVSKKVKLFNYGLYFMTGNGTDVDFPIGHPKYLSPEVLLAGHNKNTGEKVDLWSLGIVLAELVLGVSLWSNSSLREIITSVLSLINEPNVFQKLAYDSNCAETYERCTRPLVDLINSLLTVDPRRRPKANEHLKLDIFTEIEADGLQENGLPSNFNQDSLRQLYHFWQLAGGDVFPELKKEGLIRTKPPILSLPNLVLLEGVCYGQTKDQTSMLDLRVVNLKLGNIIKRFAELPNDFKYPLIEVSLKEPPSQFPDESLLLPLVIRERDTEYQFKRLALFNRILEGYPYKRDLLIKEARNDVPPFFRANVWACLLDIDTNYNKIYTDIDKETAIPTDRQIEVDIPRCHQYNELLSSSDGHSKFKRILKAWVVSHPEYVYWQGLDSLCAPFLYLNFNNEARAYICLSKFIDKYLHNFFLKDNSAVIREYLTKFKHIIAFHDPELANHLYDIGFAPELFAIPWYLTMFSHVFPIHKILHLWDSLLIGDSSYPLYVGLAILQQLRSALLSSGFNECILLFSDLPEIDIERCVKESIQYFCGSPKSITFRENEQRYQATSPSNQDLDMHSLDLVEIQTEFCPRVSGREFLELMNKPGVRSRLIVVDIREVEFHELEFVAGSVNIPLSKVDFSSSATDGSCIGSGPELSALYGNKGKIIIVIGEDMSSTSQFCHLLVRCGFPKVCCLHGGVKVLRGTSILSEGIN